MKYSKLIFYIFFSFLLSETTYAKLLEKKVEGGITYYLYENSIEAQNACKKTIADKKKQSVGVEALLGDCRQNVYISGMKKNHGVRHYLLFIGKFHEGPSGLIPQPIAYRYPVDHHDGKYLSEKDAKKACEKYLSEVYNANNKGRCLLKSDKTSKYYAHDYNYDNKVRPGCVHYYRFDFNQPPQIAITSPAKDGLSFFNNTDIQFSAKTSDDRDGAKLDYKLKWSVDGYQISNTPSFKRAFKEGKYTVTAEATDSWGATTKVSRSFIVKPNDIVLGNIIVNKPDDHQAYMPVPISISSAKINGLDTSNQVQWMIDGEVFGYGRLINPVLSEGKHDVYAILEKDGNRETKTIVVDISPSAPVITLINPSNGRLLDINELIEFKAKVSFKGKETTSAIVHWESSIDGILSQAKSFQLAGLSEGTHTITFSATQDGETTTDHVTVTVYDAEKNMGDQNDGQCFGGNPINLLTGNKYHSEIDFATTTELPLYVKRSYNSTSRKKGIFGYGWSSNIEERVEYDADAKQAAVVSDTGAVQRFDLSDNGQWKDDSSKNGRLERLPDNTWKYTLYTGEVKTFNTKGQILKIEAINHLTLTYSYSNGKLVSVSDAYGNTISISLNANGFVESLQDPDGNTFKYGYLSENLVSITYPDLTPSNSGDNPVKQYVYEDARNPHVLTGLIDEEGIRFATWSYDEYGRAVSSKHAADKEEYRINYNDDGSVTTTNALNLKTTYTYKSVKGILKISNVTGHQSLNCAATFTETKYDPETGFAAEKTDWRGNKTLLKTNEFGQITHSTVIDTGEGWASTVETQTKTSITYNNLRRPELIVTPGASVLSKYTPEGRLDYSVITDMTSHSLPYSTKGEERRTDYTYVLHEGTKLIQQIIIDGPKTDIDDKSIFEYDLSGHLIRTTNALGQATQYMNYNSRGLPTKMVDINGLETLYQYNARGQLINETVKSKKGDVVTQYQYYKNGLLKKVISSNNSFVEYFYNDARHLDYLKNNLGEIQDYTPNKLNGDWSKLIYKDAQGGIQYQQSRGFDEKGRVITLPNPHGGIDTILYDGAGNMIQKRAQYEGYLSQQANQTFDAFNRLRSTTWTSTKPRDHMVNFQWLITSTHHKTYYNYDAAGNLTEIKVNFKTESGATTDQITSYVYNGFGEVIYQKSPATGATTYYRDSAGNITKEINAQGQEIRKYYDAIGRLISEEYVGKSSENKTYTYDQGTQQKGYLTKTSGNGISYQMTYDDLGHADKVSYSIQGRAYTIDYDYDKSGLLEQMTYPSGLKVAYKNDALGRTNRISLANGEHAGQVIVRDVKYKPFGPIYSYKYGNNFERKVDFSSRYRIDKLTHKGFSSSEIINYGYAQSGNIISQSRSLLASTGTLNITDVKAFKYDPLSRLKEVHWKKANGVDLAVNRDLEAREYIRFTYDHLGNRITKTTSSNLHPSFDTQTVYNINAANNQLMSSTETPRITGIKSSENYNYLSTGQRLTSGSRTYDYNRGQRLVGVTENGASLGRYAYNVFGQRVIKIANGSTTHFHYDLNGQLISETEANGKLIREYIYINGQPVGLVTKDKPYIDVGNTASDLAQNKEAELKADSASQATSLVTMTGNKHVIANLVDSSVQAGDELYGLTMRETQDGLTGARIDVAFTAKNTFAPIGVGDISVFIPVTLKATEKITVNITYADGSTQRQVFDRNGSWLKLSRNNQYITVFTSVDGVNWSALNTYTVPTLEQLYTGAIAKNTTIKVKTQLSAVNDNLFYLHTDHLGAVYSASSNNTKQTVWQRKDFSPGASPFGLDTIADGSKLFDGRIEMPLRFPGQYYDKETQTSYNYYRDYDASIGRYIQSDPIGLGGGLNTYGYANQNPMMYTDPTGEFIPLPVITGVIGGFAGGVGNAIGQVISNGGFNCFNWSNVVVATGTGFVAGAAAPFVATSYLGAAALGGIANVVQYGATQAVNGQQVTASGAALSAATGVVGGVISGTIARNGLPFSTSSKFFPPGHAQRLNNQTAIAENAGSSNLLRSVGAGVVSNTDPNMTVAVLKSQEKTYE